MTATDLVLTVTQMLRKKGVVNKFVEFYGAGLDDLPLADRATIANMAPEYGATCGFFPIDDETLRYLRVSGRDEARIALVEAYAKANGFWRGADYDPVYTDTLGLDMGDGRAVARRAEAAAGPGGAEGRGARVPSRSSSSTATTSGTPPRCAGTARAARRSRGTCRGTTRGRTARTAGSRSRATDYRIHDGSVVIAAITSCTNTSNPYVMIGAGLVARKARALGLNAQALGQDLARAGQPGGQRLPRGRRG